MRVDYSFIKENTENSIFLKGKALYLRPQQKLSKMVVQETGESARVVNESIIRRVLLGLTIDFLEPIRVFLCSQINV